MVEMRWMGNVSKMIGGLDYFDMNNLVKILVKSQFYWPCSECASSISDWVFHQCNSTSQMNGRL